MSYRSSSTNSIVNAYVDDLPKTPVLESDDISELNDMLMAQRNSEDTLRNSLENSRMESLDKLDYSTQIRELKRELTETKTRLKEVEGKFNKIKVLYKKEFSIVLYKSHMLSSI